MNKVFSLIQKAKEKGARYCLEYSLRPLSRRLTKLKYLLQAICHCGRGHNNLNSDSVLAIYDFRANPYTFNIMEFLANAETFRMKHSLSSIDVVMVVDRNKMHRGNESYVTEANYRNWMLNLLECTDVLESINSVSIFGAEKFLDFYHHVRQNHAVFPETGNFYTPKIAYHLKFTSDYYRRSGRVPRFRSSGFLLDWAEGYLRRECYPLIPIVVFVRNGPNTPFRNTNWPAWLNFFRKTIASYPVIFFIINDFFNPLPIPDDLKSRVLESTEGTISTKYRAALTQKASLVLATSVGSCAYIIFTETPFLVFGMDNAAFGAAFNIAQHGMTADLQFPWSSKYQRIFPEPANAANLQEKFAEMYALLQKDSRLIPPYYDSFEAANEERPKPNIVAPVHK